MFDAFFVCFLFIFAILCFIEFIVFNEEILLALCFFSFVFFCFNTLSDSVYESFEDRAVKFKSDLLSSYTFARVELVSRFDLFESFRGFCLKYQVLFFSFSAYLACFKKFALINSTSKFKTFSFDKLSELVITDNKLAESFRKNCIAVLLYPLIFKTTKQPALSLFSSSTLTLVSLSKIVYLKSFSY
jgi:hypothetical protein